MFLGRFLGFFAGDFFSKSLVLPQLGVPLESTVNRKCVFSDFIGASNVALLQRWEYEAQRKKFHGKVGDSTGKNVVKVEQLCGKEFVRYFLFESFSIIWLVIIFELCRRV